MKILDVGCAAGGFSGIFHQILQRVSKIALETDQDNEWDG